MKLRKYVYRYVLEQLEPRLDVQQRTEEMCMCRGERGSRVQGNRIADHGPECRGRRIKSERVLIGVLIRVVIGVKV